MSHIAGSDLRRQISRTRLLRLKRQLISDPLRRTAHRHADGASGFKVVQRTEPDAAGRLRDCSKNTEGEEPIPSGVP